MDIWSEYVDFILQRSTIFPSDIHSHLQNVCHI